MTSDQLSSDHMASENPNPKFSKSEIGQWHPVAFFSRKIIPTETRYKTHNQKLLAIVKAFSERSHAEDVASEEDLKEEVVQSEQEDDGFLIDLDFADMIPIEILRGLRAT